MYCHNNINFTIHSGDNSLNSTLNDAMEHVLFQFQQ